MQLVSIHQHERRELVAKYETRAVSRLGGCFAFFTESRFYLDRSGKIARQEDTYSMDPLDIAGAHFRRDWW